MPEVWCRTPSLATGGLCEVSRLLWSIPQVHQELGQRQQLAIHGSEVTAIFSNANTSRTVVPAQYHLSSPKRLPQANHPLDSTNWVTEITSLKSGRCQGWTTACLARISQGALAPGDHYCVSNPRLNSSLPVGGSGWSHPLYCPQAFSPACRKNRTAG